ncbi:unnamed protein product, partial [Didymodactylos carnosus]
CVRQSTRLKKPLLTPTTTDQNGGDNDEAQEPKRSSSKLPIKDNQATFSDSDGGWEDVKDYPVPSELLLANGSHLLSAKHKNGIEIELNEDEIANGKRRKKKQQQDIDDDIEDVTPKRERSLSAKLTSNVNNDKRRCGRRSCVKNTTYSEEGGQDSYIQTVASLASTDVPSKRLTESEKNDEEANDFGKQTPINTKYKLAVKKTLSTSSTTDTSHLHSADQTDIEDCYVTVDLNTNKINLSEQQEVDFPIIYAFSFHLI